MAEFRQHVFEAVHFDDAVNAACSCGWVSPYSHAFEKYAKDDHAFHVENESTDG